MADRYDPNSKQPNNPNYPDWYASLVCPWDIDECSNEELGEHGNEWEGVPAEWGGDRINAQYLVKPADPYLPGEPDRRTMSCARRVHST